MIVEVWCPGPSLASAELPDDEDTPIVLVNRACVHEHRINGGMTGPRWLVAVDKAMAADIANMDAQHALWFRVMTQDANVPFVAMRTMLPVYGTSTLARYREDGMRFKYSKIVALALAAAIMPDQGEQNRIIIRGDDMDGTLDWDGVAAGDRRDEARWDSERADTEKAAAILRNIGITVEWA